MPFRISKLLKLCYSALLLIFVSGQVCLADTNTIVDTTSTSITSFDKNVQGIQPGASTIASEQATLAHTIIPQKAIPTWLVIPFILLLCMIATGPLLYANFWHKNYPKIAIFLASIVLLYYIFVLHNVAKPIESLMEYIQFIALIASLYIISGSILLKVNKKSTPFINTLLLLIGALIANIIGTTGASMLLIRPYIRLNRHRIKAYHIIFFIFMVSNVGGALTPIGDPPLFLGFLKGVPFFWTAVHNSSAWLMALLLLSSIFYVIDRKYTKEIKDSSSQQQPIATYTIQGKKNFIFLGIIIFSVFLDPNILDWIPAIHYHGHCFSFVREIIMIVTALISYLYADKRILQENQFDFEPIKEVMFIFIGIFGTMLPALALVSSFAQSDLGRTLISHNTLYWGTGSLSAFLDNAPTYLNCLAASMASDSVSIDSIADVKAYALGSFPNAIRHLKSISIAAVFFGAMTYIGNGPNFMVRSIAVQAGIHMPSFFGYLFRFSIPILLPILVIIWIIFC